MNSADERRARLGEVMPALRAFVRQMTRNTELAEEVIQETCLRVLGAAGVPYETTRFSAWCRGVARNVWMAQQRRSAPRSNEVALDSGLHQPPDARFDPERRVYASEKLERASSGLDGESAQLLVRRYLYGERAVDLAGEHEKNPTALRTRLWRLRSTLRAKRHR